MNRTSLQNIQYGYRQIVVDSAEHKAQLDAWTQRILDREHCVPDGYIFTWKSGSATASNTAYLYDAAMCNVQYAQSKLKQAEMQVGKQAFSTCIDAARVYMRVIRDIMPRWTFRPKEIYAIPDTHDNDMYGHYFLARAMAYGNVGLADLTCPVNAQIAAYCNAAHLYAAAAQLISGDTSQMLHKSQLYIAKVLQLRGDAYLEAWETDSYPEGAAKALACYKTAHMRLTDNNYQGCEDKVAYATERNGVHWLDPVLPEWKTLVQARITAL